MINKIILTVIVFMMQSSVFACEPYKTMYDSQEEVNQAVCTILRTFSEEITGIFSYGRIDNNPITTQSSFWENVDSPLKDNTGKPIEDSLGKQITEPTITLSDLSCSLSEAIKDMLKNQTTMECLNARVLLEHVACIRLLGEEKYDAYAQCYIKENEPESVFFHMTPYLWVDSKERGIGAFSYIPNIRNYHKYRCEGSLQGENVVMIGAKSFSNNEFINEYLCFPADGKDGFEIRDENEIFLSFKDDLSKSKTLQKEEFIWRHGNEAFFDETQDHPVSMEFINQVKGLHQYQIEYYAENAYYTHHYFDVNIINLILKTPAQNLSMDLFS